MDTESGTKSSEILDSVHKNQLPTSTTESIQKLEKSNNLDAVDKKEKKPKVKQIPANLVIPEKKTTTKAERRALQEAQRAAKLERLNNGEGARPNRNASKTTNNVNYNRTSINSSGNRSSERLNKKSGQKVGNEYDRTKSNEIENITNQPQSKNRSRNNSGTYIIPKAKSKIANPSDIDDPQIKQFALLKAVNDDNSYLFTQQMIDINGIKPAFITNIDNEINQSFREKINVTKTACNSYFKGPGNITNMASSSLSHSPQSQGQSRSRRTSYKTSSMEKQHSKHNRPILRESETVQYSFNGQAYIFKTDPNDPRLILSSHTEDENVEDDIKPDSSIVTAANFGEGISRAPAIMDDPKSVKKFGKKLNKEGVPLRPEKLPKMNQFAHLPQYQVPFLLSKQLPIIWENVQPYFLTLGLKYANRLILGANARTVSFLAALKKFVNDYTTPPNKALSRDMEVSLRPALSFLNQCRPICVGTGNFIKYIKMQISMISIDMLEDDAKQFLQDKIQFLYMRFIMKAHKTIMVNCLSRIYDNDIILTYGGSSVVKDVLIEAIKFKRKIQLIVIDSKPLYEGRQLSYFFSKMGINVTYSLLNGVSCLMKQATKVLLGANSISHNGYAMTRVGSAIVANVAHEYNVPVLVCAESYKVGERAQTDAVVFNELGDPDELFDKFNPNENHFNDWSKHKNISLLNLMYDIIPPSFIFCLVTEFGITPCSSAPSILRISNSFEDAPRDFD